MMAGQSIGDRLSAAKYSIAGQGLAKSVCKATTEEVIGPKKKHLDYLLHCTNEPNVSIPQLANLLVERTIHSSWVVVFKALVTVHHLMCYGNERFTQYLASSNSTFQLGNFLDKTNVQVLNYSSDEGKLRYDMSTFIRRYAKYLNEKALSYRTVAFDFCKVKRGKEDGTLRTMNAEKLLKTVPVLQSQIDALLEFDCTANELSNGVINAAFMLLFRDLIRLFACYNDGIINLLEKYFDMNKKMCRDALDIYKKFLIRMDRVAEFLKVAERMGLSDTEMPAMSEAPSSLLDALEQHLAALEGKKGSGAGTPTQPTVKPAYLNAVTALSSTSSSFGSAAAASGRSEMNGSTEDTLKKIALEEEQAVLNQHRFMLKCSAGNEGYPQIDLERRMKELGESPTSFPAGSTATNPFLSSPTTQEPTIDIFEALPTSLPQTSSKASDDLLNLSNTSNPFADSIMNSSQPTAASQFQNDFWGNQNGFDMLGDVLQPANTGSQGPSQMGQPKGATSGARVITGDLDSSLSLLAQNLDINRGGASSMQNRGGRVWNSPKNTAKTGGANWTPHMASSTAAGWNSPQHGFKPMGAMTGTNPSAGKPADWSGGMMGAAFPSTGAAIGQQPQTFMTGARPVAPVMGMGMPGGIGMPSMGPAAGVPQPMFNTMQPRPPTAFGAPMGTQQSQQPPTLDPFGAL